MSGKERTTEHYKAIRNILGKRYIQGSIENPYDFVNIANRGLNAHTIVNFRKHYELPRETVASMLNVSEPTVYRWVRENKKLERNYAVQLFELTDLFLLGTEVFQDKEQFFKWLNLPNTACGGIEPLELLEIPGGISKVRDLLGRIEHGVYS